MSPLLSVENVSVAYRVGRKRVSALRSVSFVLATGERLGVVGESGSGKTTLARALLGLITPDTGVIRFQGKDIAGSGRRAKLERRRHMQMVFQDATGSLNARMRVAQTLGEVLRVHGLARTTAAARTASAALLARVGLPADVLDAYPGELSGGQCQRVSLARALALRPMLLIADEPVSALDVSVQARILRLLHTLSQELNLACLLIAHDLAMVRQVCERMLVLQAGRIVEAGETEQLLNAPQHPYTRSLVDATPDLEQAMAARSPASN